MLHRTTFGYSLLIISCSITIFFQIYSLRIQSKESLGRFSHKLVTTSDACPVCPDVRPSPCATNIATASISTQKTLSETQSPIVSNSIAVSVTASPVPISSRGKCILTCQNDSDCDGWCKVRPLPSVLNEKSIPVGKKVNFRFIISTYRETRMLVRLLNSIHSSDVIDWTFDVYVLNHLGVGDDDLDFVRTFPNTTVIDDKTRPDFSLGHLARTWNNGIVNGFHSLREPDADWIILAQADAEISPNIAKFLLSRRIRDKFFLVHCGVGDCVMAFTAEAIRHIGLFDERFSSIFVQEMEYSIRAVKWAGKYVSIQKQMNCDWASPELRAIGCHSNVLTDTMIPWRICNPTIENYRREDTFQDRNFMTNEQVKLNTMFEVPRYMFYPYFECDVYNLTDKNYIHMCPQVHQLPVTEYEYVPPHLVVNHEKLEEFQNSIDVLLSGLT
eukprot:c8896_g1_i1.p1 GENE.c8896_g1_i1~~c8896_g1_i1.p1  ORF type:complete len:443 (-),score=103.11 c8896_g1_i1:30-1358(-)